MIVCPSRSVFAFAFSNLKYGDTPGWRSVSIAMIVGLFSIAIEQVLLMTLLL